MDNQATGFINKSPNFKANYLKFRFQLIKGEKNE